MKKEVYIIIRERIDHFESLVNNAIKKGYLPIGGVSVDTIGGGYTYYCQALVLKEYFNGL